MSAVATGGAAFATRLRDALAGRVVGLEREIELFLAAVIAGRHVLVEGVPGLGKTLLARSLATALGCRFTRIQFTPDLLPADILGGNVYVPAEGRFELRRGPIFAEVILADEINRAPAKTQAALLEVMQERQVTIEGQTLPLERPFFVFATQNPIEHEGVYPLPQAQLDRFAMRLRVGYPSADEEQRILAMHRTTPGPVSAVTTRDEIVELQEMVERITVSQEIIALLVELAGRTREHDALALGASPRLGLDVLRLGQALALIDGREHVAPDDVKRLYTAAANHRIGLHPHAEMAGRTGEDVIDEILRATALV